MRKHRIWYGVILIMSVIMYIVANNRSAVALMLGLILVPIICGLVQLGAMRKIRITYNVRKSCRIGQEMVLEIKLKRASRLPMGAIHLHMQMENILFSDKFTRTIELQPTEKKEQIFLYPLQFETCGDVQLKVVQTTYYDLTGLFCRRKKEEVELRTLVYPPALKINTHLVRHPETEVPGDMYDSLKKGQDLSEVSGLRDYAEGDPLRSIHWKLSGKTEGLIVRESGYPSNYNTVVLCDLTKKLDGKPVPYRCNDAVLALTMSLSYHMLKLNLEHNVVRVIDGECQSIPVDSIESREKMEINLLCRPITKEKNSGDSLYYFMRSNLAGKFTKMIYITPNYDEDAVKQLAGKMDLTIIHIRQGNASEYADTQEYSVVPIEVDNYVEKSHNIVI